MEMEIFYKFNNNNSNSNHVKTVIKNVKLVDINLDYYEFELKPENLKYFKEPKITEYPLNLNEGYDQICLRQLNVFYGNSLSKVIKYDVKKKISSSNSDKNSFNIFTHRNAIINIITSRSIRKACRYLDWNLCVTKFGNNFYMYSENDNNRPANNLASSYYSKLDQILFSDSPNTEPKTDVPVDENIRLNGIYQCQLGKFNLIYSAEVQGIISDTEIQNITDIESLNQCRFVKAKAIGKKHPTKGLQAYFQNYLTNVDVSYLAIRDNEGYVHSPITPEKTEDMCKNQFWNPKDYEQFLYDFLSLIAKKMAHVNDLLTTYEFKFSSKDSAVYCKIHEGQTEKSFLAKGYIKFIEKNNSK